jgi:ribosomal protein S16
MPRNDLLTYRRGIVLNRHKIRYWLAQGAQPTRKVANILSRFGEDFWPRPPIPGGSQSIYQQPPKKQVVEYVSTKKYI